MWAPDDRADGHRALRMVGRRGRRDGLRAEALDEFLDDWEAANGALTAEERERASAELGLAPPRAGSGS